jgi:hypothetical protein
MHRKLRLSRPRHATVVAYIALFVALGGTTYAATGGNFILGQSNTASSTTGLSAGVTGPAFRATNTSTGPAAGFNVSAGHAPFTVNSGTKVTNLNADKIDGKDSTAFLPVNGIAQEAYSLNGRPAGDYLQGCPTPALAAFGRICAGSDGGDRTWNNATAYCAAFGFRLPTPGEAVTLGKNYDVPGVAAGEYFWTDNLFYEPSITGFAVVTVNEDGGNSALPLDSTHTDEAVCVTEPRDGDS